MVRILVLSDSHGDVASLSLAIRNEPTADVVIYLGDGANDIQSVSHLLADKRFVAVRGNCDSTYCEYPVKMVVPFEDKVIYCTHGHNEHVKFGLNTLKTNALYEEADIVLFGHTHNPYTSYADGIHFLNPGSVRQNSCGIIDIIQNGVMCFTKKIVP